MGYDQLSEEAKEVLKNMVYRCVNNGSCMGMSEGYDRFGDKEQFRQELEKFCDYE